MKFIAVKNVYSSACLLFLSALPKVASANAALEEIPGVPSKPLDQVLGDVTDWLIDFGIMLCVLLIVWGGVNYVAAMGDEQRITSAKKTIHYAIWGIVIIAFSYAILEEIDNTLT